MTMDNFTNKELVFIGRIMKPFTQITAKHPGLYYEFLEKVMNEQLTLPLNHPDANAMIESIIFKLAMRRADEEMEKMLTDPSYGNAHHLQFLAHEVAVENTKASSWSKVTNFSEKHQAIVDELAKNPGLSRRELAAALSVPINRITPRVLELIEMSKIVVAGTKYDTTTDRNVQILRVA